MHSIRGIASIVGPALVLASGIALAGPLDPNCTPKKAARGAATKATVGVGGRCGVAETAKDTTKRAATNSGNATKPKKR
jgi:hypothetical protein